jgi:DNA-binding LytR/AlgR family response regulator
MNEPSAIIADDEEHLRAHLRGKLALIWPELKILAEARNGLEAESAILNFRPSVAFLDIKMPGLTGLQVAQRLEGQSRFVFVTAYDNYALEAFEHEAVDFLVKPVADDRLERTVKRLRAALAQASPPPDLKSLLETLLAKTSASAIQSACSSSTVNSSSPGHALDSGRLRWFKASRGDTTVHIPVQDVHYVRSDDKYSVVYTADGEHLVRMAITEIVQALDPEQFWQIHRSIIVNTNFIASTRRDEGARLLVRLHGRKAELPVSRAWMHLFK